MRNRCGVLALIALLLSGCGLKVPQMQIHGDPIEEGIDEDKIVGQIKCELHKGIQDVLKAPPKDGNNIDWLKDWGAKVQLSITVDEKGNLAPGFIFNTIHPSAMTKFANGTVTTPQTYSLSIGFSGSAAATRKEVIGFAYAFRDLLDVTKEKPIKTECANETGVLVHSDLRIGEFIAAKMFVASIPGAAGGTDNPFTTFSDEVTFVLAYGGSLTPSWKLLRFSAGPQGNSPMLGATRTKTHDIIVTIGKVQSPPGVPVQLSNDAENLHQAVVIGHAVNSSMQGQ